MEAALGAGDGGVSWTSAAPGVELVLGASGLDKSGKPSRACKQFLFEQFGKLVGNLAPVTKPPGLPDADWKALLTKYAEAKAQSQAYQVTSSPLVPSYQTEAEFN